MTLGRTLSNLPERHRFQLFVLVALVLVTLGGYQWVPSYAAFVLAGAAVVTAVVVEDIARTVISDRTRPPQRRLIAASIWVAVLVLAATGVLILRTGNGAWDLIALGGVAGVVVGIGLLGILRVAEERSQLAWGVAVVILIVLVAGVRGLQHLLGLGTFARQATLAGGGFIGFYVVVELFIAYDIV